MLDVEVDNAMLSHVQYLRELLDLRVVDGLCWADTRDMIADGLTKGAIAGALLLAAMEGRYRLQHECLKHLPVNAGGAIEEERLHL